MVFLIYRTTTQLSRRSKTQNLMKKLQYSSAAPKISSTWASKSLWNNPHDWTSEAQYPEIVPPKGSSEYRRYSRLKLAEDVRLKPSLREKYYRILDYFPDEHYHYSLVRPGWKSKDIKQLEMLELEGFPNAYDALSMYKELTKTELQESEGVNKDYYAFGKLDEFEKLLDAVEERVKQALINAWIKNEQEDEMKVVGITRPAQNLPALNSISVFDEILRTVRIMFSNDYPHLLNCRIGENVNCEAYWWRSGGKYGEAAVVPCEIEEEKTHHYESVDFIHRMVRSENMLPPVVDFNLACSSLKQSEAEAEHHLLHYDQAQFLGIEPKIRRPKCLPGFNFGDPKQFASLLYKSIPQQFYQQERDWNRPIALESIISNLLLTCFSQCISQAYNQGFTCLNPITYPLVTQMIMSDGLNYSFMLYQLNTNALWQEDIDNPRQNFAFYSVGQKLFDSIEEKSGQFVINGWNRSVLKNLLGFMLKGPSVNMQGEQLRPHLDQGPWEYVAAE